METWFQSVSDYIQAHRDMIVAAMVRRWVFPALVHSVS